jgi:hypothetical protein
MGDGRVVVADAVVSLREGGGVEKVKEQLVPRLKSKFNRCARQSSDVFFTRARYIEGLERCCELLGESRESGFADIVSQGVSGAIREVEEMVGRVDS